MKWILALILTVGLSTAAAQQIPVEVTDSAATGFGNDHFSLAKSKVMTSFWVRLSHGLLKPGATVEVVISDNDNSSMSCTIKAPEIECSLPKPNMVLSGEVTVTLNFSSTTHEPNGLSGPSADVKWHMDLE